MNDLISRQAVKEWLDKWEGYIDKDMIARMQYRVIDIPSAQERKKGRWEVAIGYDPKRRVMCTECHRMAYEPTPFCPNCGADMRGEEE